MEIPAGHHKSRKAGYDVLRVAAAADEGALAEAVLAPHASQLLYGRVDLARDEGGRPMIMELELIEPSLYLVQHPPALARLSQGIARRLS